MTEQAIIEAVYWEVKKTHFKHEIYEILNLLPLSKKMITKYLSIPEPILSEYLRELLSEKLIFEMNKNYCYLSKKDQKFYGTQKTVEFIKRFQNEK